MSGTGSLPQLQRDLLLATQQTSPKNSQCTMSRPSVQGITISVFVCMKKYIHMWCNGYHMKNWKIA
jgi:hypothetical protein